MEDLDFDIDSYRAYSSKFVQQRMVVDNIEKTRILKSNIHGNGLFATEEIKAGILLTTLDGQVVNFDFYNNVRELCNLGQENTDYLFMEWNCISYNKLLVRMFRTKYSYINHSRKPNCKLMGFPPKLWTISDIDVNEELTLDYRDEPLPLSYTAGHGSSYL